MRNTIERIAVACVGIALLALPRAAAHAAVSWKPEKAVEIIATNAPGGGSDRVIRIMVNVLH